MDHHHTMTAHEYLRFAFDFWEWRNPVPGWVHWSCKGLAGQPRYADGSIYHRRDA